MTRVKVCGMMRPEDLEICLQADYLGFVVRARSRRELEMLEARQLMSTTAKKKVMVTTEPDPLELVAMANFLEPDVVQAHSLIDAKGLENLRKGFSGEVWTLVPVGGGGEVERLESVQGHVDAVLLDTKGLGLGGQGIPHDWLASLRLRRRSTRPIVLAGGLCAVNVREAIRTVRPDCVDVSSGVEFQGIKDPWLVKRFIDRAKEED